MSVTPDEVYRACAEASWDAPGTRIIWQHEQRDTYIALMLRRPDWRALVDTAYRAGREDAARDIGAAMLAESERLANPTENVSMQLRARAADWGIGVAKAMNAVIAAARGDE